MTCTDFETDLYTLKQSVRCYPYTDFKTNLIAMTCTDFETNVYLWFLHRLYNNLIELSLHRL